MKEPTFPMVARLLDGMGMTIDIHVRPKTDLDRHDEWLEDAARRAGWVQQFESGPQR